jgi:hypothetical protein
LKEIQENSDEDDFSLPNYKSNGGRRKSNSSLAYGDKIKSNIKHKNFIRRKS